MNYTFAEIKVKSQVGKLEGKRTCGRTRPNLLPSSLTRTITIVISVLSVVTFTTFEVSAYKNIVFFLCDTRYTHVYILHPQIFGGSNLIDTTRIACGAMSMKRSSVCLSHRAADCC